MCGRSEFDSQRAANFFESFSNIFFWLTASVLKDAQIMKNYRHSFYQETLTFLGNHSKKLLSKIGDLIFFDFLIEAFHMSFLEGKSE